MSIPGYDNWKLMTPEEDYEAAGGRVCPICGAYDTDSCEMTGAEDELDEDVCPWELSQPDPDDLMEQRREDREMEARNPRSGDDF
jgi:hypothetical protein